ncbi:hypothetical protein PG984_016201 [Apiospora sp. TS-2023a]
MTAKRTVKRADGTNYTPAAISLIQQVAGTLDNEQDADLLTCALVLSTFRNAGIPFQDLKCDAIYRITDVLHQSLVEGEGVIGSAPGLKARLDCTAMGIQALSYASKFVGIEGMLRQYEAEEGFCTYAREEYYSPSANCQALAAIACQDDIHKYDAQWLKALRFLCQSWWDSDGEVHDELATSHLQCSLRIVQGIVKVLELIDREAPDSLLDQNLQSRLLIVVFQACLRAMLSQGHDGSWSASAEQSAYGVLLLCEARRFSMFKTLVSTLDLAVTRGVTYLQSVAASKLPQPSSDSATSQSLFSRDIYVLAALHTAALPTSAGVVDGHFDTARATKGRKHVKLLQMTPLFSELPDWQVQASMIESSLFQPLLHARRLDIFPRKDMEDDAKYFDLIPLTWTSCNNHQRTFASTSLLYEMMVISFLNYQADEFLESCAGRVPTNTLRQLIDDAFLPGSEGIALQGGQQYPDIVEPLGRFVSYVSTHPCVQAASAWDRASVLRELRIFLHAHVTQLMDNVRFQQQKAQRTVVTSTDGGDGGKVMAGCDPSQQPFFRWVRTTSANHTSCPYSFSFVGCLMSSGLLGGKECFPTVQEKYLGAAACLHLATMCRMYNDYGSTGRDAAEGNLNSIDFPEYDSTPGGAEGKKRALFDVADYERTCLDHAFRKLRAVSRDTGDIHLNQMQGRQMDIWQMFCDVTDLYGQIYAVRDIGSRVTGPVISAPEARLGDGDASLQPGSKRQKVS